MKLNHNMYAHTINWRKVFCGTNNRAMFTLYRKVFSADMKTCPVYYGQQRYRTGTCRSHTSNIVPERLDDRVWWTETPVLTPEFLTSVLADSSHRSYLFTPATVRYLLTLHQTVAQNPSDMWRSNFEFGAASLRYRNRAEIPVLMRKQNPYPLCFPYGRKSTMRA